MRRTTPPARGPALSFHRHRRTLSRVALTTTLLLAAEAALLSAGSGTAVALNLAEPRPATTSAEPEKPAAREAADLLSAKVAARLSGHRVEALSERTGTSTTWVNKDGSLTTELAAGPVRFERDGQWTDVDVNLREVDGGVAPKAHPEGLRLAGKTGTPAKSIAAARTAKATDLVTLGEGEQQITLQWKGGLPRPKLDGPRAEYVNAVPGADVVVEATRTGFEQYVEIKKRPAGDGYTYTLPLKAKGLTVRQLDDGSVQFTDKKSKRQAVMPAPVMWDASVDARSGEHTRRAEVGLEVVRHGSAVDLVVTPDAEFLADPETDYPVTVDPSTSALSNVFDTYVQQGETVDWSADTELDFGNPGTTNANGTARTARSFVSWNTSPVQDALVSSAKLSLWNFHSGNTDCKAYPWEVWSAGAASTASRWTAQPAWTAVKATSTETTGNSACTTQPDGWINADVTTLVQEWASAKATRGHLGLRATDESVIAQWKRVNSANAAANPPKLVVNYNYRPRTGTKQEAGPPYFSYGGAYVVNTTTPTLRDTFVDADGDKVDGTFQIFDSATDTQVGNVLVSPYVPSGQVASVTVPAGVLADGKTYRFRTSPYDGTHYNTGWSAWKTFTVDTKAPSAPTKIVSTDYPAASWVKGAGQAGTFTVTPPSGTDHNWLEWSLDGTTWTKVATGGAAADKALSIAPPKDGTHTLQVRAVDKADNRSEAASYTFHAGPGGFVRPADGERTARRLPLVAEADAAKYANVAFSWRRSEADDWTRIPVKDVTRDGQALTAWPVALAGGRNAALVWNATDTVDPDGSVQIKADFTGPDSAAGSTEPLGVVVNRVGTDAASTEVGPGSVNLLTGDLALSATDAAAFGLSVVRSASSRQPRAAGALLGTDGGQVPIFGKEWLYGASAGQLGSPYGGLVRTSDTSLSVSVLGEDTAYHFTATKDKTGWVPEAWLSDHTLTGGFGGDFALRDADGKVTTFKPVPGSSPQAWRVATVYLDGLNNSTTTTVSEQVTVDGKPAVRPKKIIAPTSAATASACEADSATRGCRVLEFGYATATTASGTAFGDVAGQVKEIRLWSTAPGAAAATARTVQSYAYDTDGRLRRAWNPQVSPALVTEYGYDDAGRVTRLTPPGELPWTFEYGTVSGTAATGAGMLLSARRAALAPGSTGTQQGEAVTSVVYDVPLSGTAAPYALGAADVKAWGQTGAPTDATAVFPADAVPASHQGSELAATAYKRATVHYLGVSGQPVNTAAPGGHISALEYDRFGNTVRELSAGNRARALGLTATDRALLDDLGIAQLPTAERAELLSERSLYSTNGARLLEEFKPLQRVDLTRPLTQGGTELLAAGLSVTARPWTVNAYDEGRPTDGTATVEGQLTTATTGVQVREHPAAQGERKVARTEIDWAKGLAVKSVEDAEGLALTTTTGYDAQGRVTQQVLPGATATGATTRVSAYWSATGTGTCQGRPEWADLLCSVTPGGAITGGGSQPSQLPTTAYEYDVYGSPAKTTETANGTTRTTATAYDAAGRPVSSTVSGGVGTAVPAVTTEYDAATGKTAKTVSASGSSVTRAYDALGRQISYTDADGGTTTSTYDVLDRPVKVGDSVPSSVTYTYDTTAEPRGLPVKATDSVAGTFGAAYNADGDLISESLPGGYTMRQTLDASGEAVQRTYTRDADGALVYSDAVARSGAGRVVRHSGWSDQQYQYDTAGRLKQVDDTANTVCTVRKYTFDQRANRTGTTTLTGTPGTDCPTTGGTSATSAYDSADRAVNSGYAYDAFGRTTALPSGAALEYYANDLARRQTVGTSRQTWTLDPLLRTSSWTVETGSGSAWTQTQAKTNHYASDGDSPRWITENTGGTVTRMVESLGTGLGATTGKSGDVTLQLATIHGDIALQLPLDASLAPVALDSDEYGNARTTTATSRYGWLGAHQRSAETLTGALLMGARLYDPATGRFLTTDPVYGGNSNAYEYCSGDPVNCTDLDGKFSRSKTRYYSWGRIHAKYWGPNWGTGIGGIAITIVANKRWTYRIGAYGWVTYTIAGAVLGILAVVFPPAAPVLGVLAGLIVLVGAAIQFVAQNASARGQCLHINTGASVYTKWWIPRYSYGRYAYPWRGRC
ncbi:RHS repeat-associated core domain containing protein-containing protein [Actinobacteria bacterium OK074]|nr:RHS repeat-associated core domain containing protein-containing protein [Actinobacteria bacterium OK074]